MQFKPANVINTAVWSSLQGAAFFSGDGEADIDAMLRILDMPHEAVQSHINALTVLQVGSIASPIQMSYSLPHAMLHCM